MSDSTRQFDGKTYQYGGVYPTKQRADSLVVKLRKQGRCARVIRKNYVRGDKAYFIYWRTAK